MNILNSIIFYLDFPFSLIAQFGFMLLIGLLAYWRKWLTVSGSLAAAFVGVCILWCMRLQGFVILLYFFAMANLFSHLSKKHNNLVDSILEKKGNRRDGVQVLANGGLACLGAILYFTSSTVAGLLIFSASLAEAISDTLAGDAGRLSPHQPFSIRTHLPVKKGLSGGVTFLGLLAGLLSSASVALLTIILFKCKNSAVCFTIITFSGFIGCVFDSFLGAYYQVHYWDESSSSITEKEFDSVTGDKNDFVRGLKWMDNDMVNFISNLVSVIIVSAFGFFL